MKYVSYFVICFDITMADLSVSEIYDSMDEVIPKNLDLLDPLIKKLLIKKTLIKISLRESKRKISEIGELLKSDALSFLKQTQNPFVCIYSPCNNLEIKIGWNYKIIDGIDKLANEFSAMLSGLFFKIDKTSYKFVPWSYKVINDVKCKLSEIYFKPGVEVVLDENYKKGCEYSTNILKVIKNCSQYKVALITDGSVNLEFL